MDKTEARLFLRTLLGDDILNQFSEDQINLGLGLGVSPDSLGKLPGDLGYAETVDPYWVAAELVTLLAIQQNTGDRVVEFSDNNSRFKMSQGDLMGLATQLRLRSSIRKKMGSNKLIRIIGSGPKPYVPTSSKVVTN